MLSLRRGIHTVAQQQPHFLRLERGAQPVFHTSSPCIKSFLLLEKASQTWLCKRGTRGTAVSNHRIIAIQGYRELFTAIVQSTVSPQYILGSLTSNIEMAHLDIALCPMIEGGVEGLSTYLCNGSMDLGEKV